MAVSNVAPAGERGERIDVGGYGPARRLAPRKSTERRFFFEPERVSVTGAAWLADASPLVSAAEAAAVHGAGAAHSAAVEGYELRRSRLAGSGETSAPAAEDLRAAIFGLAFFFGLLDLARDARAAGAGGGVATRAVSGSCCVALVGSALPSTLVVLCLVASSSSLRFRVSAAAAARTSRDLASFSVTRGVNL